MTVTYNLAVSNVGSFTWVKLLFRWRGSIWKSVSKDLLVWIVLYYVVMSVYRTDIFLGEEYKRKFEDVAYHINSKVERIPLTFMLGFFVSLVVDRWRQIFVNMGWVENQSLTVACLIRGNDPDTLLTRRSIVRYLCLTQILVFRDISMKVRRRFPTLDSIVKAGFMQIHEKKLLEEITIPFNVYWAPINWAMTLCFKMREQNKITSEPSLQNIINEIKAFRTSLHVLCNYDWVPIPLAYPQVVFLAVRVYFCLCLVGRQFIIGEMSEHKSVVDMYVPLTTCLEFIFFVGWMKVAEALLNPMGEDDDDFECNYLIDKNIETGLAIVDDCYDQCPELKMDVFKVHKAPLYPDSNLRPYVSELVGSVSQVNIPAAPEPTDTTELIDSAPSNASDRRKSMKSRTELFKDKLRKMSFQRSHSIHVDNMEKAPNIFDNDNNRAHAKLSVSLSSSCAETPGHPHLSIDTLQEVDEEQLTVTSLEQMQRLEKQWRVREAEAQMEKRVREAEFEKERKVHAAEAEKERRIRDAEEIVGKKPSERRRDRKANSESSCSLQREAYEINGEITVRRADKEEVNKAGTEKTKGEADGTESEEARNAEEEVPTPTVEPPMSPITFSVPFPNPPLVDRKT